MKSSPRRLLVFLSETMTMEVVLEVGSTLSAAAYLLCRLHGVAYNGGERLRFTYSGGVAGKGEGERSGRSDEQARQFGEFFVVGGFPDGGFHVEPVAGRQGEFEYGRTRQPVCFLRGEAHQYRRTFIKLYFVETAFDGVGGVEVQLADHMLDQRFGT